MRQSIIDKLKLVVSIVNDFLVSYHNDNVVKAVRQEGAEYRNSQTETLLSRNKNTYKINRYYASTQECSNCHRLNKIPFKQRIYVCKFCGLTIDRDLNSGIDNDAKGPGYNLNARGHSSCWNTYSFRT